MNFVKAKERAREAGKGPRTTGRKSGQAKELAIDNKIRINLGFSRSVGSVGRPTTKTAVAAPAPAAAASNPLSNSTMIFGIARKREKKVELGKKKGLCLIFDLPALASL